MEIYLSLLNNQMTKAANETNNSVRRMSLIMTIFMPLTLLAGIGGMSEWVNDDRTGQLEDRLSGLYARDGRDWHRNYYLLKRTEKKRQDQD